MLNTLQLSSIGDAIGGAIKSLWEAFLEHTLWRLLHFLETLLLRFIALIEDVMMVFTGEKTVEYNHQDSVLINVFFNNSTIRGIYAGIAQIGIAFAFVFAVVAVIRKILDLRGKQQGVTLGTIIGNLLKSILLIFSMNAIVIVAITTTNVLTTQVSYAIQHGDEIIEPNTIVFTDEQFAAMGRIINTIGNYSLNPSYRSRYNLNACYNDIRVDLKFLADQGVFKYHYVSKDGQPTWQSVMEELARACDYENEVTLDSYNDGLTNAMLDAMELFKRNPNIKALPSYTRVDDVENEGENVPMDRILFLVGTMGTIGDRAAARTESYNVEPSFYDAVRYPFYLGEKGADIYDFDDVRKAFEVSPGYMNYIVVYAAGIAILMEMMVIIVTCAVRIFNLLALYISSPLVIAAMPLDDGGKFKQWTTAFIIQLLGVVGMVLSMRLFLMFLPVVWSPALKISDSSILNCIVKAILTYGGITAVNKVNGILTGILADNAGYQAIYAGNMRDDFQRSSVGKVLGGIGAGAVMGKVGGALGGAAKNVAGKWAGKAADATGLSRVGRGIRSIGEAVGVVKKHDKSKDPEAVKHERSRERQRKMDDMKANLDYAATHNGKDLNGKDLTGTKREKMEKTLEHMQNNKDMSYSQASRLADVDHKQDKKDAAQNAANRAKELKAAPPPRELPGNQNTQV